MKPIPARRGWTALFALWCAQSVLAGVALLRLPSDPEGSLVLGMSAARLALLALIVLFGSASAWLTRRSQSPAWTAVADRLPTTPAVMAAAVAAPVAAEAVLVVLGALSQGGLVFAYAAYAARLGPLLHLLAISSLELLIWIVWLRRDELKPARSFAALAFWIWLGLGVTLTLIAATGLGVEYETIGVFSKPTIPFWEWQIVLAWFVGGAVLLVESKYRGARPKHPDLWIGAAIWLGVCALWLSQPVNLGWLAGPRAPNFEPYPYSDALTYDQFAQSVLIGNGFFGDAIPARPLYVVFLAALHAIAGQDYSNVIAAQTLVLALFPATLYLLGTQLSGRPLGFMLAFLAASRDVMTNFAADYAGNFSFSKFYLSELPTALLLSLFVVVLIRSVRREPLWLPGFMLCGGLLGLSALIRTQTVFVLPAALLLAWLAQRADLRQWTKAAAVLVLTTALTIAPWLWRNWQITGSLLMDDPYSQMAIRATWYHGEEIFIDRQPGESDKEYSARLVKIALDGVRQNPGLVTRLVTAHMVNNQLGNLLVFPVREDLESPLELLGPTRAFWDEVELKFGPAQSALLAAYLLLFSLGIAAAWRGAGWLGLIPLAVNLSYNFSNSLFMSSGMRFLLAADWAFYCYYALGLLALARGLLVLMGHIGESLPARTASPIERGTRSAPPRSWVPLALGCAAFFLLGSSLPLSEQLVPQRYPAQDRSALTRTLLDAAGAHSLDLTESLADPALVVLRGRALYPRYYAAGEGERNSEKIGFGAEPEARLVFSLVGDADTLVVMYLPEVPSFFPNASDVILVARDAGNHLVAEVVLVEYGGRNTIYVAQTK